MQFSSTRFVVVVVVALTSLAATAVSASAERYIYWGDYNDSIWATDVDAQTSAKLVDGSAGSDPNGVSIDRRDGRLYWVARSSTNLYSVNLDGSDLQAVNMGPLVSQSDGTAIDAKNRRIYWPQYTTGSISWADLDDLSQRGTLSVGAATVTNPQGIAVDSLRGRVYWTNNAGGAGIPAVSWAPVDGSGTGGDLFIASHNSPAGVSYSSLLDRLFWTDYGAGEVWTARPADAAATQLTSMVGIDGPGGTVFDEVAGRLWVGNYGNSNLSISDADGSNASSINASAHPWGVMAASGAGNLTAVGAPLQINAIGGAPTSGLLTLRNTGDYSTEIYGTVHASGAANINAGAGCPEVLAVNAECQLTVTYTPASTGNESASASVGLKTDTGDYVFPVTAANTPAAVASPKLTGVRAVTRCASSSAAGRISIGFTSATATSVTASIQRSSTRRKVLPSKCPARAGSTDYASKVSGKKSSKKFNATAGEQTKTLKQLFGTKQLAPGRYRILFSYKDAAGRTVRKGTWVWALR